MYTAKSTAVYLLSSQLLAVDQSPHYKGAKAGSPKEGPQTKDLHLKAWSVHVHWWPCQTRLYTGENRYQVCTLCTAQYYAVLQGPDSAYFTVFASSYLPVHTSKISKADTVYQNLLGTPMLKVQYSSH